MDAENLPSAVEPGKASTKPNDPAPNAEPEKPLSNAELKKRAKAEKQAKRQARKAEAASASGSAPPQVDTSSSRPPAQTSHPAPSKPPSSSYASKSQGPKQSASKPQPSSSQDKAPTAPSDPPIHLPMGRKKKTLPPKEKEIPELSHAYNRRDHTKPSKDVHPSIQALGLQIRNYEVCGSTARLVAMLLAFKEVINSYTLPIGKAFARHFIPTQLSPQIEYLRSCRPISISMGNAIRSLKEVIVRIDPADSEEDAKKLLLESIDDFIRERVQAPEQLIIEKAGEKITNDDCILTYSCSSLVRSTILRAHADGKRFEVWVVDSKPLYEGKALSRELADAGIKVSYCLVVNANHAMERVNKVFVGAHAMWGNGNLYSRVGTGMVCCLAAAKKVPVVVLCQSVKFTEKVVLDSFAHNEMMAVDEYVEGEKKEELLDAHRKNPNLFISSMLFDTTPAKFLTLVVSEYGNLPPTSIPVVLRLLEEQQQAKNEDQVMP